MRAAHTLILSLDVGASLTKGFVTISRQDKRRTDCIQMESDVVAVDRKYVKKLESLENTNPENNAWIAKKLRQSGEAIAVGTLAKKFSDFKIVQIERVKYEYAVEKILAAIGAIIEKHQLEKKDFEVIVNLVVPSDECEGKESIEKSLKAEIGQYQFRGEVIEGKLKEFNCFIEGMGGILYRAEEENSHIQDKKVGVIMLGHRNSSCLILDKGTIGKKETERIGYFDFLTVFKEQNVGQKITDLEELIPRIDEDGKNADIIFKSLIRGERRKNQYQELRRLQQSYKKTKKAFWKRLHNWLDVHVPTAIDEILILGGTANQFKAELTEAYGYANLYWGEKGVDEIIELLPDIFKTERILGFRFLDIYGIHKSTINLD